MDQSLVPFKEMKNENSQFRRIQCRYVDYQQIIVLLFDFLCMFKEWIQLIWDVEVLLEI